MAHHHTSLVNGSFDQAISAVDRGFTYGDGVFRTMRIKDGQPISWPFHYQKLVADCAVIGIVCPSAELLMCDIQQLFPIDEFQNGEISVAKIIITRGEGERGYAPPAVTIPTRVLIKSAMPTYADANYAQGVRLHLCETRLALQPKLAGIKHLNRLENILARMEWRDESVFDGLMLDTHNNVIECTMSNLFARVGDHLYTPDLTQCGVAGITRQRILGLGSLLGLTCSIATLSLQDLLSADELFICNSLYGAFQVTAIDNQTWEQQALASTIRNILTHG
ncbi:aminodeoxychorismate lyase [Methylotenera sp. L2L1]|uniref:aminodeoxychorismate lyase n=1 Tax=Methylotenera sp. L2L1 TaxID=1502770 RepID=UPI00055AB7E0|nr:aminodeoxychorismate lyase [Methylotenera sp. L2L1]